MNIIQRERITPADAGKTVEDAETLPRSRDHPRGCGENENIFAKRAKTLGSPPRMRGKRERRRIHTAVRRITPADAGKTAVLEELGLVYEDHPRGCGENAVTPPRTKRLSGSPPRMRGKPLFSALGGNNSRITPADAGKTPSLFNKRGDE